MRQISSLVRWLAVLILVPIAVPVAKQFIDSWIQRKGFYDHPDQAAGWIENLIVTFAQAPGVLPATIFLTGLTVGIWLDWFTRRIDGTLASQRQSVGHEFRNWADIVDRRVSSSERWPQCIYDCQPDIRSIFLHAKKLKIWTPGPAIYEHRNGPALLLGYLRTVGTFLAEGHFKEAKAAAWRQRPYSMVSRTRRFVVGPRECNVGVCGSSNTYPARCAAKN